MCFKAVTLANSSEIIKSYSEKAFEFGLDCQNLPFSNILIINAKTRYYIHYYLDLIDRMVFKIKRGIKCDNTLREI